MRPDDRADTMPPVARARGATVDGVLRDQAGVIARRQVLAAGGQESDIAREVRRHAWARVHTGVYVDHTGPLTWLQRAWAGVLFAWPAALAGRSAIRAVVGPGWRRHDESGPIWVAVPLDRRVRPPSGLRVVRCPAFADRLAPGSGVPRQRLEDAVLDEAVAALRRDAGAAHGQGHLAAVGALADACQSRRTTARRLREVLRERERCTGRSWLEGVLTDVGDGSESVLERGYLTLVERPHGLPRADRQAMSHLGSGRVFHDVEYVGLDLLVELDGRLFHDTAAHRDRDLDRDLHAAVSGRSTVRLGWGQVFGRPCRTATALAAMLQRRGWTGALRPCGPGCPVPGR